MRQSCKKGVACLDRPCLKCEKERQLLWLHILFCSRLLRFRADTGKCAPLETCQQPTAVSPNWGVYENVNAVTTSNLRFFSFTKCFNL